MIIALLIAGLLFLALGTVCYFQGSKEEGQAMPIMGCLALFFFGLSVLCLAVWACLSLLPMIMVMG